MIAWAWVYVCICACLCVCVMGLVQQMDMCSSRIKEWGCVTPLITANYICRGVDQSSLWTTVCICVMMFFFLIWILFFAQKNCLFLLHPLLWRGFQVNLVFFRFSGCQPPYSPAEELTTLSARHRIKPSATSNKEDRETEGENDEEKMWFRARRGSSALHDTSHLIGYQHEPQICRRHIFRGQIGASCWDTRQPGREGRGGEGDRGETAWVCVRV